MVDLMAGLALAKGVVDLAKNLKDLSDKSGDLTLKEAAEDLRSKTIDLKSTVNDMRDVIIDLEKQLEFKEKLSWNGKTFEYENDGKKAYICNGCQPEGKFTHMTEIHNERGYFALSCPACQNKVVVNIGNRPEVKRMRQNTRL